MRFPTLRARTADPSRSISNRPPADPRSRCTSPGCAAPARPARCASSHPSPGSSRAPSCASPSGCRSQPSRARSAGRCEPDAPGRKRGNEPRAGYALTSARNTRVGSAITPSPMISTREFVSLCLRMTLAAFSISPSTLWPFNRISSPPSLRERRRPGDQRAQRRNGARGHRVEHALVPTGLLGPRPLDDDVVEAERRDLLVSQAHRRSMGSMRIHSTSGRAIASTMPGRPPPDPTSPTRPAGNSGARDRRIQDVTVPEARQLLRSDQAALLAVLRQRAGELAREVDAITEQLTGRRGLLLEERSRSANHRVAVAALAIRLRDVPALGDDVVDDLALVRAHRRQRRLRMRRPRGARSPGLRARRVRHGARHEIPRRRGSGARTRPSLAAPRGE